MLRTLGILVALVLLTPHAWAQHATVRDAVVNGLFADVRGTVTVRRVSEDLDRPVVVEGLDIVDPDNRPILSVERLELERTGRELIAKPRDTGFMKAVAPQFVVHIGEAGLNVTRVFGSWFFKFAEGKQLGDLVGAVESGHVHVIDAKNERQWIFTPVDFSVVPEPGQPANRLIRSTGQLPFEGLSWSIECRSDNATKRIDFSRIRYTHEPTASVAELTGTIREPGLKAVLELDGFWTTQWEAVSARLAERGIFVDLRGTPREPIQIRANLGDAISEATGVKAAMQQAEQLASGFGQLFGGSKPKPQPVAKPVRPPHWLDNISVTTSVAWDRVIWQGFVAEPTRIPVTLKQGVLEWGPQAVLLNGGRMMSAAKIDLTQKNPVIELPEVWLLKDVILTPEVCAGLLAYVAPVVADATNVEGRISVGLRGGTIPLLAPEEAEFAGDLVVDSVRLDLSPAFGKWAGILRAVSRVRLIDESVTKFAMKDGVITHEGFGFLLGDSRMWTHGEVDLDRHMDVTVDVKLGLNFLPNGPIGRRLKGAEVSARIAGSLDNPEIGDIPLPAAAGAVEGLIRSLTE